MRMGRVSDDVHGVRCDVLFAQIQGAVGMERRSGRRAWAGGASLAGN